MSRLEDLQALTTRTKKPLPWYGLGMELRGAGRLDEAVATFRHLHTLHPQYVAAYFMCGQVLSELGATDAAIAELRTGMEMARLEGDDHAVGEMSSLIDTLTAL